MTTFKGKQRLAQSEMLSLGLAIVGLVSLAVAPTNTVAALLQYDFAGNISQTPTGTTISAGEPFSGRWIVNSDQSGVPISEPNTEGKQYHLERLTMEIAGTILDVANVDGLFISESEIFPPLIQHYPSGYSSDYSATSLLIPDLDVWGTTVRRFAVSFSYDGRGIWDNFSIPTDFEFLSNPVSALIAIDTSGTGPGSGVRIFGNVTSVVATPIPVPPVTVLLALSLLTMTGRRDKR